MHNPLTRQLFSMSMGLFIHFYVFGAIALISLGLSIVIYMVILVTPK